MPVRYCISYQTNQTWAIIDQNAGPNGDQAQTVTSDFTVLLDAIHYMFSHGYGEFSVRK